MDEKRMVGDYTVINSMYIGHKEIILGENPKAANAERDMSAAMPSECCSMNSILRHKSVMILPRSLSSTENA
jgi:hypothetical protein